MDWEEDKDQQKSFDITHTFYVQWRAEITHTWRDRREALKKEYKRIKEYKNKNKNPKKSFTSSNTTNPHTLINYTKSI